MANKSAPASPEGHAENNQTPNSHGNVPQQKLLQAQYFLMADHPCVTNPGAGGICAITAPVPRTTLNKDR